MPLTDIPGTTRTGKSTATLDGVFRRNRDHNTSGAAVMRCPRWVNFRRSPGVLPTSGVGGKADEIRGKADIGTHAA